MWFTLSHGIITEVYYPEVDRPGIRDLGCLVSDGWDFFSEEKKDTTTEASWIAPGVPAFELTNTCRQGRYKIVKGIVSCPCRSALLQQTEFIAEKGELKDYHLYVLLAPHLHDSGSGNTAWVGEYKGTPMLLAEHGDRGLALACSVRWLKRSAGFVGISDGWQDVHDHKRMKWEYARAEAGNVALTGEVDLLACRGRFLLALGFGRTAMEAAYQARASLRDGFSLARDQYGRGWEDWQKRLLPLGRLSPTDRERFRISAAVIKTHEANDFPGAVIASLSIPWGEIHGDTDRGGYHLVWPRDAYESCGAMLAAGAKGEALRTLNYLQVTQEPDGHWPQNMWLDGIKYWAGRQLDETAAPILLFDLAQQEGLFQDPAETERLWPMIRKAATFLVEHGPVTEQDRWEENPGFTPYTLAAVIAALLIAADLATRNGDPALAGYFRETADAWNDSIEEWTYVADSDLARKIGVEGYYLRITPVPLSALNCPQEAVIEIKNRPPGDSSFAAAEIISPDALALVRFGLRSADDPRILNTIRVIDTLLRTETPSGPAWHRYRYDGYGEHADGTPFDGRGIGRAWPLLTGERAHYELAAGHVEEAQRLLATMEAFASQTGLLPEQIWDSEAIPGRQLFFGQPSGSARPLVWAHAEHIKLLRSLRDGRVFDQPPQTVQRYLKEQTSSAFAIWRFECPTRLVRQGCKLRIEVRARARVRWTTDEWLNSHETDTRDTGLGLHLVDLPVDDMTAGQRVTFTFYWIEADRWEGRDFTAAIGRPPRGIHRENTIQDQMPRGRTRRSAVKRSLETSRKGSLRFRDA